MSSADRIGPLDPAMAALRDAAAAAGVTHLSTLTPGQARERNQGGNRLCDGGPDVAVSDRILAGVPVRGYAGTDPRGTLVYLHGGGWVIGDLDTMDEFCRFVAAQARLDVVSVDYRLAPEHPFPAGLDDVLAVVAALDPRGVLLLGGDSAGGNLAAACALTTDVRIDGLVLLYPVLDARRATPSYLECAGAFPLDAAGMEWFFDHYLAGAGEVDLADPRLSPLAAHDLSDHPPVYLVTVGHDPLRDEGFAYADRLREAGAQLTHDHFPALGHSFLRFTGPSEQARKSQLRVVAEVDRLATRAVASLH